MNSPLLETLQQNLLPKYYRRDLSENMPAGYLLFKQGAYVGLVMPFQDVPANDFGSKTAKGIIRQQMTCLPVLMEKGLFLIYYGPAKSWSEKSAKFTVDKTALRPVILQSIHFLDLETGENVNSRTHWGPLKFGFCTDLINDIERFARRIQKSLD